MVDAVVSFAVQRLGDFLIQEANLLLGVHDEVVWIRNELNWMQSFLKDAEQKQDVDERIRMWINEIKDIALNTEDVIDTFYLETKGTTSTSRRGLLSTSVKRCFCISGKTDLFDIGKEIGALKKRILDISQKREVYGINNISSTQDATSGAISSRLHDLRITTSYADEEHVVGFEDDAHLLEAKLFLTEPRRCVLSILGMGGLGKTTLARMLYNKNKTKFNHHAWVCVSQEWKSRDLLERIIKSFKNLTKDEFEMLEKMKDYDMERYLREFLEGSQYLIVIDDVWQEEAWERLRRALPDNENGSRIIITTRILAVAELSDQRTYVHKLRFLRQDESWELFCKKAFPTENGARPQDMEKLGQEMVAKCDGLPLAIIVLGGLLSRKQFHEWHTVKERIWRELKNKSFHILSLLDLSYQDLPHELKSCFLYLGLFPEDFVINAEKLVRLWVAEDFILQGDEGLDLEELAENYLKELIGRSLIQVVMRNWTTISMCRVHDLLRDLAVNKARELNFLHVFGEIMKSAPSTKVSFPKRIAFRSGFESYMSPHYSHEQVRTLSFLSYVILKDHRFFDDSAEKRLMTLMYSRFKLLRVLDLEGVGIFNREAKLSLFEAMGKLIHLRYLGLNGTIINELPESIGNLQALQTLDVSENDHSIMLPRDICKLKQLRHLKGSFGTSERRQKGKLIVPSLPSNLLEELTNLQSLTFIDIDGWLGKEEGDEFALNAFAKLRNLKVLSVRFYTNYMLSVEPLFNCRHLLELKISGNIGNLPIEMYIFLPKLKYLRLLHSGLMQDPMPALEKLPNLLALDLDYVRVEIMTCTATGFPQLEVLKLSRISDVTKFQVEERAMPRLRALSLDDTEKHILPERLRSLPEVDPLNWDWEYNVF